MATPLTAYIDMEFAGIYGTRQIMQIPIEIGVVLHDPGTDTISFAGKPFSYDVDVELWKNITDDVGKRVDGKRRVFNLAEPGLTREYNRRFRLDSGQKRTAQVAISAVHRDLRRFMQALNHREIGTLVFFARQREIETFRHARVNTEGFLIRDLQAEIKNRFSLKEHVSLDRMSLVIGFGINKTSISSKNISYQIPEKFRYVIRPHKAIGDAARMLLLDAEFNRFGDEFRGQVEGHMAEYERRKSAAVEDPKPSE
ncbi:hypothetical protein [uncultured Methanoregula sp.]|uniref:hypothetical protein n=1 Tax=uncultured Methanoregula sp. TaxID=1005933 RepID=UPI002AAC0F52|nr:hypothetical protein [uncultured Methanoregula sp.]